MTESTDATTPRSPAEPEDFAATITRLEGIVERLESGELSLEAALGAFEQGIHLARDAQSRLDQAELKVRALSEDDQGRLKVAPFDAALPSEQSKDDGLEETPPW